MDGESEEKEEPNLKVPTMWKPSKLNLRKEGIGSPSFYKDTDKMLPESSKNPDELKILQPECFKLWDEFEKSTQARYYL